MKRTQIQIPDPLYKEVKRLAALKDWSVKAEEWELPAPGNLGKPKIASERWRDLLVDDETGGPETL